MCLVVLNPPRMVFKLTEEEPLRVFNTPSNNTHFQRGCTVGSVFHQDISAARNFLFGLWSECSGLLSVVVLYAVSGVGPS